MPFVTESIFSTLLRRARRPARRLSLLLLLCWGVQPALAQAEDAARERAAARVVAAIGVEALMVPMMEQIRAATLQRMAAAEVPEGQEAVATPYLERMGEVIEGALAWPELEDEVVSAYATRFDAAELDALAAFFESPLGRKYLESVGPLNLAALDIIRSRASDAVPEIARIQAELQAALGTTPGHGGS